jgi:hypothetical protein
MFLANDSMNLPGYPAQISVQHRFLRLFTVRHNDQRAAVSKVSGLALPLLNTFSRRKGPPHRQLGYSARPDTRVLAFRPDRHARYCQITTFIIVDYVSVCITQYG